MPVFYKYFRWGISFRILGCIERTKELESYLGENKKYCRQIILHFPRGRRKKWKVRNIDYEKYRLKPKASKKNKDITLNNVPWNGEEWIEGY